MTRRDFSKVRSRQAIADRGHEPIDGGLPLLGVPARPRASKAAMRSLAEDLLSSAVRIQRILRCVCGHQFRRYQPLNPPFPKEPCTKCGRPL